MSQNQVAVAGMKPVDVSSDFVKRMSAPNSGNLQNLSFNLPIPGFQGGAAKTEAMGSLLKCMSPPFLLEAQKHFDFWTEEENIRFVNAIESVKFPPDFAIVSARLGNKTPEQCSCYASFYYSALQHHRNQAESKGLPASFHIKAADVYAYLGVSPAYSEFVRKHKPSGTLSSSDPLSPSMRAAASSATSSASATRSLPLQPEKSGNAHTASSSSSSETVCKEAAPSSKSSIDFLCGGGEDDKQPDAKINGGGNGDDGKEEGGSDREGRREERADVGVARNRVKRIGAGQNPNGKGSEDYDEDSPQPAKKRFRAASPTKDKERDIERNRIEADEMWEYACMQDGAVVKEEDLEWEKRDEGSKNPWDWTRKMIVKPNGYANWFPLFTEYVQLSRRDVSDDMRSIRDKTPGAPSRHGDDERDDRGGKKGAKQRKEQLHEWVRVGSFVEVKWEGDWWHAKVKKLKQERGTERLDKVFVSYVGGTEDEDEWVPAQVSRIRAPREDVTEAADSRPAAKKSKTSKRR